MKDSRQFWLVRSRPGGIEVPILDEDVAQKFQQSGWKVTRLPLAALGEKDLRCLRFARQKSGGNGAGRR